jgi:hypothetical protein
MLLPSSAQASYGTKVELRVLELLVAKKLPKVAAHLAKLETSCTAVTSGWFAGERRRGQHDRGSADGCCQCVLGWPQQVKCACAELFVSLSRLVLGGLPPSPHLASMLCFGTWSC